MINIEQAHNQSRQLRAQADRLFLARSSLNSYQNDINIHWKGVESMSINQVLNVHMQRLVEIASDIESISRDVIMVANAIRREEEMR